ncbi:hypothetical protein C1645_692519 [Glomus cerebriforme]|uniref:3D domain-containing protein n=1 Tax=Glomus cerebriforme TaxID=658196 RepID=A0A397T9E2_9GLOM|nr:hypothetical protein C1645_692519 [Glomus cerebriforme]
MSATLSLSLPAFPFSGELISSKFEKRGTPQRKLISNKSAFTYYWVASEASHKTSAQITIKDCKNRPVATVNRDFAIEMKTEGSGISKSGLVFNFDDCSCGSSFNCFVKIDKNEFPFGIASNEKPLRPFVTVAANDFKLGTLLFIPALVDVVLPGGQRHNGCVVVDDQGHGFGGKHIDWFVASEAIYRTLDNQIRKDNVQVFDGASCTIKDYSVKI